MTNNFNFPPHFFAKNQFQDQFLLSKIDKLTWNDVEKSLDVLNHLLHHLNIGIWVEDFNTNHISYISKGALGILQISDVQELYSGMWEQIIHEEDHEKVLTSRELLMNGEVLGQKYRIYCKDNKLKWIHDQSIPLLNDKDETTGVFRIFFDITSETVILEQQKHKATHDLLTGLPNQRSLYEKIDELIDIKQTDEFALLYLDLDRFTLINDSLGHYVGDLVLKRIANRLLSISSKNVHVTCLSNNDFVIIIEDFPSKKFVADFARKLTQIIDQVIIVNEYKLHVTTSVGISHFPSDGTEKVELLANAHTALNRAKQDGINNIEFYSLAKDISSFKKLSLEQDMRNAIENKEFELYYQPIVNPSTQEIDSAEALIRWNHSKWGLVSPGEFIPLAEENHEIIQITHWVIEEVCEILHMWKDEGFTLKTISINISPICFMKRGFVEFVKNQIEIHGIDTQYISFEITENSLLKNDREVLNTLTTLRHMGIQIALDDFGTGFSSLQYLRNLPIDIIKIDQIFIKNIQYENLHDAAIISSIMHLAKQLNLVTIAEGVENDQQLEFLKENGCDLIQGYLFSKPVPLSNFSQILKRGYIELTNNESVKAVQQERRTFPRLAFPAYVIGNMSITEINNNKVKLGSAYILIQNISLGGLKILSSLNLSIHSAIKFSFFIALLGESFEFPGQLIWKEEAKGNTFYYGVQFMIDEKEQAQLAHIINQITTLLKSNQDIPNTPLTTEDPHTFLMQNYH